jgi:hypothetical protein
MITNTVPKLTQRKDGRHVFHAKSHASKVRHDGNLVGVHSVRELVRGESTEQANKQKDHKNWEEKLATKRAEGAATLDAVAPKQQADVTKRGHGEEA